MNISTNISVIKDWTTQSQDDVTYSNLPSLAQFRVILFCMGYNITDIRATWIVPYTDLPKRSIVNILHGSSASSASAYSVSGYDFIKVSDTSMQVNVSGSKAIRSFAIYGIK